MIARLAWTVARPSRAGLALTLLPITAFAVTTALLLVVAGAAHNFWVPKNDDDGLYQFLASVALALLVVPLAGLGGAAVRLSARRRDDRLATLRLLGAPATTVSAIAVLEATVLAAAGAVVGIGIAAAVAPAIGALSFRGEILGASAAFVSPPLLALVVGTVVGIAAISAVLGLRRVVVSPLGVRRRTEAPRLRWLPPLLAVGGIGALALVMKAIGANGAGIAILIAIAIALGGAMALLNVVGPFAIGLWARVRVRSARTPAQLLAARGVLDSPRAVWRQVGGTAAVSFVAVVAGSGVTLLASANPDPATALLVNDLRTGLIATICCTFAMVACSVGVTQAAAILDDAPRTRALARLGTPLSTLDAARRRTVIGPMLFTSVGSAVCAAIVLLPLVGMSLIVAPLSMAVILGTVASGLLLVVVSLAGTRHLLRRTAAEPA